MMKSVVESMKKWWGAVFFGLYALLGLMVWGVEGLTGFHLRSAPRVLLTFLGILAGAALLFWVGGCLFRWGRRRGKMYLLAFEKPLYFLLALGFGTALLAAGLINAVTYRPEQVVVQKGQRLVARSYSFSDERVSYYQYKTPFFYGEQVWVTQYGGGGQEPPAPAEREETTAPEVTWEPVEVIENRENEPVLSLSIEEYIGRYNERYRRETGRDYLRPWGQWTITAEEATIHRDYDTVCCYFTADDAIYPLPTISVYVPPNGNCIQQITVNFDDHSYTESMFQLYEQMCFFTLQAVFPEMTDGETRELAEKLNRLAYENIFPHEQGYKKGCVPSALYCRDSIGIYAYFAAGEWVHFTVIPLDDSLMAQFRQEGVEILGEE